MKSLRQRLISGLGANSASQVINTGFQVLSVPMFIQAWGMSLYGEWLLLSTVPAYLALSDMGFASVTGNKMTMSEGAGDRAAALRVFQSGWVFVSIMCLVMGLALFGLGRVDLNGWLNLTLISKDTVDTILLYLGLFVGANLQIAFLNAGFRASGHYARGVWLNNLSRIAEIGTVFIVLYAGGGPAAIAAAMAGVRVLTYGVARWQLNMVAPWVVIGWRHATGQAILDMTRPAIAFMGFPIGNAIKNQGVLTVVGVALGPAAIVPFNTTRTLVNAAQQVLSVINSAVWPEMSRAFGANDIGLARNLHRMSCQTTFWLAAGSITFLALFGEKIYTVWTLGEVELDRAFFLLMLLAAFINSFWYASSVVLASSNRHEILAALFIGSCFMAIAFSYMFAPTFGLVAVALSLAVMEVVLSMYVVLASLRLVQDSFAAFLLSTLTPRLPKLR